MITLSTAMTQPSVLDQKGRARPNYFNTRATGPEMGFRIQMYSMEPTTRDMTLG